jgi:hypothetical protein
MVVGRFDPLERIMKFLWLAFQKIWDKKTAFNTLDMAMRFGRAT